MIVAQDEPGFWCFKSVNRRHSMGGIQFHIQGSTAVDESIQYRPRLIGRGKKLPCLLFFKCNTQGLKPADRLLDGKCSQNIFDEASVPEEVGRSHQLVRHIATTAT